MTTLASLADEFRAQPYALAAFLDLGRDYDISAELDDATETEYREQWAAGVAADPTTADYQVEVTIPGTDDDTRTVDLRDMNPADRAALRDAAAVAGDLDMVLLIDTVQ